jgi:hypothetical protein
MDGTYCQRTADSTQTVGSLAFYLAEVVQNLQSNPAVFRDMDLGSSGYGQGEKRHWQAANLSTESDQIRPSNATLTVWNVESHPSAPI